MQQPEFTPPSSVEAEEGAIGSVLINSACFAVLCLILKVGDFFIARHMWIWDVFLTLKDRGDAIDNITVMQELRTRGQLDDIGGPAYITQLINSTPTHINATTYAAIVVRASLRRQLLNAAADIAAMAVDGNEIVDTIIHKAVDRLAEVRPAKVQKTAITMRESLSQHYSAIEERYNAFLDNSGKLSGVPTGFIDINKRTGGWQKKDLVIIASRPGMGKTSLALTSAVNAASLGYRIAFFSFEMSIEQLNNRMLSAETGIPSEKFRTGDLTGREWEDYTNAIAKFAPYPIYFDDSIAPTITVLHDKCKELVEKHDLDLIIVDYLQLVKVDDKRSNREQQVSAVARGLKEIAREFNVPVIALAQINREVENRANKRPQLADLRESGEIEQASDIVAFIYRDEYYTKESSEKPKQAEIIFEKHRNGARGTEELYFEEQLTLFADLRKEQVNLANYSPSNGNGRRS